MPQRVDPVAMKAKDGRVLLLMSTDEAYSIDELCAQYAARHGPCHTSKYQESIDWLVKSGLVEIKLNGKLRYQLTKFGGRIAQQFKRDGTIAVSTLDHDNHAREVLPLIMEELRRLEAERRRLEASVLTDEVRTTMELGPAKFIRRSTSSHTPMQQSS